MCTGCKSMLILLQPCRAQCSVPKSCSSGIHSVPLTCWVLFKLYLVRRWLLSAKSFCNCWLLSIIWSRVDWTITAEVADVSSFTEASASACTCRSKAWTMKEYMKWLSHVHSSAGQYRHIPAYTNALCSGCIMMHSWCISGTTVYMCALHEGSWNPWSWKNQMFSQRVDLVPVFEKVRAEELENRSLIPIPSSNHCATWPSACIC